MATQLDADSPGRVTVLYSTKIHEGLSTEDVAKGLNASVQDIRIINNSQAAQFLASDDFLSAAARLDGVALDEFTKDGYRSPTSIWLYHPTDGPWAEVSGRFADGARGEVRAIVPNAVPDRVFGATELPRILANPQVTAVEGLPRPMLAQVHAREGQQAVFEMVAAQSHANLGGLRAGTNYAGTLLHDDQGRMQLDSRAYFKDGPVQGRAPDIAGTSRELGELAGPPSAHVQAGQARVQAWRLEVMPDAGINPGAAETRLARALGHGAAVVATGVEVANTAHDYGRLRSQGNLTAAQAAVGRSASTGAGAWLGFEAGLAAGSPLGPGALAVGAVGAVVGGVAGDKLADKVEHHRIYTQRGSDGNTWQADPAHPGQGWTRTLPPLPDYPQGQRLTASPELADELNYKAVSKATELALASARARDPFRLPASRDDAHSAYGGDWIHNPHDNSWQRQINRDKPGLGHPESASPERAAQLDAQSRQITADNAAHSPAALAATFKVMYEQNDWQRHGKMPEAVENTLAHPERVLASDGRQYAHQASGQWIHDGMLWNTHADGNLRTELDLAVDAQRAQVRKLLQPGLAPDREIPTLETVQVTAPVERKADAHVPAVGAAPPPATAEPQANAAPAASQSQPPPASGQLSAVDQAMLEQVRAGVRSQRLALGNPDEAAGERLSHSLLAACKDKREQYPDYNGPLSDNALKRVDHVVVGTTGNLFAAEGALDNPASKRTFVTVAQGMQTPIAELEAKLEAANQTIAQEQALAQQREQTRVQGQGGPTMGM
ncbi:hypothetical protein OK348_06820 [Flavobacterium sp. MXW15]|uniref:X-Tfes XVIPCD domain-containing protein n=1 Tax=Xanthomonas chitinilytica TaxID=2989819 RepID=A0ABT3JTE3_9XANT|nr:XVIPCD domain-containing protein [Xanthomonas sp. H13-6]MCW4454505.1 hypothetical protein [Flavobacterium sp. MXW15]MCW4471744.1 hypothetical protein [Xanthomonas sp. H13-6]